MMRYPSVGVVNFLLRELTAEFSAALTHIKIVVYIAILRLSDLFLVLPACKQSCCYATVVTSLKRHRSLQLQQRSYVLFASLWFTD